MSGAPTSIAEAVATASQRRARAGLPDAATDAFRLVHGEWDAMPGLHVDRIAEAAIVRVRDAHWAEEHVAIELIAALGAIGCSRVRFVNDRPRKHDARGDDKAAEAAEGVEAAKEAARSRGAWLGDAPFCGRENGLVFEFSAAEGFSSGLFLDMRQVRADLRARWSGRRVANLFAYTCGFGVALAGMNEVVNVDVSARYLDWGRRNYTHNGLDAPATAFVRRDAFEFLEIAVRRGVRWDAIVLDPPVFSHGKGGRARRFSLRTDLEPLVDSALGALADDGELFVSTNLAELAPAAFEAQVERAARRSGRRVVRSWPPGPDFPVPAARYHLKTALVASSA